MVNSIDMINSRLATTKERTYELEVGTEKFTQNEAQKDRVRERLSRKQMNLQIFRKENREFANELDGDV